VATDSTTVRLGNPNPNCCPVSISSACRNRAELISMAVYIRRGFFVEQ